MKKLLLAPLRLLAVLFGQFSWSPPTWLTLGLVFLRKHLKIAAGLLCAIGIALGLNHYIQSLPKAVSTKADFSALSISSVGPNETTKVPQLYVDFSYDLDALNENQPRPQGQPATARIDLLNKEVKSGITLSPEKAGKWTWDDDNRLSFKPETPWPAGIEYEVDFDNTIFTDDIRLSDKDYSFSTPPLTARMTSTEFYQDPTDASIRRVIATIEFSHPIETASVEKRLQLEMQAKEALSLSVEKHDFSVTFSKNNRFAYVQSTPVSLPDKASYMTIKLEDGVTTLLGGKAMQRSVEGKEFIPDIYSFLKVSNVSFITLRNEKNQPEQVLSLEFTDPIEEKELLSKLNVYQVPNNRKPYLPNKKGETRVKLREGLVKSKIKMVPNERSSSKVFNFIVDEPENSYLFLRIDDGLTSVNNFIYDSYYDNILSTPSYPREINISGNGSILSASGNNKLSILTRLGV